MKGLGFVFVADGGRKWFCVGIRTGGGVLPIGRPQPRRKPVKNYPGGPCFSRLPPGRVLDLFL